jgi:hypothetical protein
MRRIDTVERQDRAEHRVPGADEQVMLVTESCQFGCFAVFENGPARRLPAASLAL